MKTTSRKKKWRFMVILAIQRNPSADAEANWYLVESAGIDFEMALGALWATISDWLEDPQWKAEYILGREGLDDETAAEVTEEIVIGEPEITEVGHLVRCKPFARARAMKRPSPGSRKRASRPQSCATV